MAERIGVFGGEELEGVTNMELVEGVDPTTGRKWSGLAVRDMEQDDREASWEKKQMATGSNGSDSQDRTGRKVSMVTKGGQFPVIVIMDDENITRLKDILRGDGPAVEFVELTDVQGGLHMIQRSSLNHVTFLEDAMEVPAGIITPNREGSWTQRKPV